MGRSIARQPCTRRVRSLSRAGVPRRVTKPDGWCDHRSTHVTNIRFTQGETEFYESPTTLRAYSRRRRAGVPSGRQGPRGFGRRTPLRLPRLARSRAGSLPKRPPPAHSLGPRNALGFGVPPRRWPPSAVPPPLFGPYRGSRKTEHASSGSPGPSACPAGRDVAWRPWKSTATRLNPRPASGGRILPARSSSERTLPVPIWLGRT